MNQKNGIRFCKGWDDKHEWQHLHAVDTRGRHWVLGHVCHGHMEYLKISSKSLPLGVRDKFVSQFGVVLRHKSDRQKFTFAKVIDIIKVTKKGAVKMNKESPDVDRFGVLRIPFPAMNDMKGE